MEARLAVAVLLLGAFGCGAGSTGGDPELLPAVEDSREIFVEVKNLNFYDAELYLRDESGHRVRLGFVAGNATENFTFRWPPARELQVQIHLISVGTYLSDVLPVEEGDELELIIEPDLHRQRPASIRPE